jgi:signal transduction histidine kinase
MARSAWRQDIPLLVFLILLVSPFASAQLKQSKKVLILEDQTSAPAVEAIEKEFIPTLDAKSPDHIDYFRESLDTVLITDPNYPQEVRHWLKHKYAHRQLDLVVSIGPESHEFLRLAHEEILPGIPVVFCLDLKRLDVGNGTPDPNFTGVWMDMDPVSTVDVARQLLPSTKRVAVVAGTGYLDQKMVELVQRKLKGYTGIEFIYLTDLDVSSLLKRISTLPNGTVILFLTMTRDRSLDHFFARETLRLVSGTANVPVFGLIDTMVGRGLVGGYVTNFSGQGTTTAEMAARILEGQMPVNIPAVTASNRYVFDWKQLQRWGIDASRLPSGNVLVNRELTVWERYHKAFIAVLSVLLLQTALVLYLFIEHTKRRRAQTALENDIAERIKVEAALRDLSSRLITAQEEERSRIARELHDDFNQRLAMLAMDLEKSALIIPKDQVLAVQRMHELWDQASSLGSDLHTLSHNLHSSVLDCLGLVEGVRTLCTEFTEQQGVQVEFASHGVPRTIAAGTSLCIFRIVQEGLRNVKKHSGANKASVQLDGNGQEIMLSITDEGVGFDLRDSAIKGGLGLRSMQERLRSVGGTVEIHTRHEGGTQLSARAPIHSFETA